MGNHLEDMCRSLTKRVAVGTTWRMYVDSSPRAWP
jgi:hypothetical protein